MPLHTYMSINYNHLYISYSLFKNNNFTIFKPIYDTNQCDYGISLITKYSLSTIILSTNCNIKIYKIFKDQKIKICLIEDKHFRNTNSELGLCV
ncbi:hypothetical protein NAPIS_ORF00569 [Vairimorpha apis BRL 01]|uniref:Uncharacterized protein n=1 Tax=Vairimorpha apis BRL 01 TaxID=1037528 RepID=T0MLD7_9MICR|nr:hypothetical protein NAPIS_ORF00569 [Vairimorpha apis BRL 01]